MSKLREFIKNRIFPIEHTGIGHTDDAINTYQRKLKQLSYKCSLCETIIKPEDWMEVKTQMGMLVKREQPDFLGKPQPPKYPWEVLGFICIKCNEAITEADIADDISYG
jgi:hypothetical protein